MCGIAGVVDHCRREPARSVLRDMAASMIHRGPDDQGIEVAAAGDRVVGLCSRRLAIQDCSPLGHQPMRSQATGRLLAFNGELYNVESLRTELAARGHRFRGSSDTEVVLRGFDEWGTRCLDRFRGMFALALWDAPQDRLVLARDRLGIKPLYYCHGTGGALAFASELRTLLRSGVVERRISRAAMGTYLGLGAVREPLTMVEGVQCLPAAHVAIWKDGTLKLEPYWSLDAAFARTASQSSQAAVASLRETLEEAVRLHLVSDVPLGVFLSGGIDSSALVGLVSRVAREPPRTVSVVFPQQRFSEAHYATLVSRTFGTQHTSIELDDATVLDEIPRAVEALDQPTSDGINTFVVSGLARSAGLTVALSGLGGDELFGGYDTFRIVPYLNRIRRWTPSLAARAVGTGMARFAPISDRNDKLERWLCATEPEVDAYSLRRELFGPRATRALMPGVDGGSPRLDRVAGLDDEVNELSKLELEVFMRNVLLRDSDVMSMAHGLEIRVPLLDHLVVEAVAAMSGRWKRSRKRPKPLLVDALADLLPDEVVHRRKMGFTLPFEEWLRSTLRERVESALADRDYGGQVAENLDSRAVADVWRRFLAGETQWHRPWALYVLKAWGERHAALSVL
jgi:asparagine synthase (glutamine-hydrolysing)